MKNKSTFTQGLFDMELECNLPPIPASEIMSRIDSVNGQFFAIDFARKNDKKINGVIVNLAGEMRHMVCRTGVGKFVQGSREGRKAEDTRQDVLTVWDVATFHELRKQGMSRELAGVKSYRRINMADVKDISIAPIESVTEQVKVRKEKTKAGVSEPV